MPLTAVYSNIFAVIAVMQSPGSIRAFVNTRFTTSTFDVVHPDLTSSGSITTAADIRPNIADLRINIEHK